MTSETTERKPQGEWGRAESLDWIRSQTHARVEEPFLVRIVDDEGDSIKSPRQWGDIWARKGQREPSETAHHEAVEYVASELDIPVPWLTDEEPPTEGEGKWSEPVEAMSFTRRCEVAQLIGGGIFTRWTGVERDDDVPYDHYFGCWWVGDGETMFGKRDASPDDAGESAIRCLAHEQQRYNYDTHCVWLGDLPMPPDAPPAQSEVPATKGEAAAERFACRHHTLRRVVGGAGVWTCKYCAARFAIANLST